MDGRRLWTDVAYMDALNCGSGLSKYSKKSENFRKGTPVDKERQYENVPNYSVFYFRDRRYIFPKLLEIPKLLPKRMALIPMYVHIWHCMCDRFYRCLANPELIAKVLP